MVFCSIFTLLNSRVKAGVRKISGRGLAKFDVRILYSSILEHSSRMCTKLAILPQPLRVFVCRSANICATVCITVEQGSTALKQVQHFLPWRVSNKREPSSMATKHLGWRSAKVFTAITNHQSRNQKQILAGSYRIRTIFTI